jgi:hypothetical protein
MLLEMPDIPWFLDRRRGRRRMENGSDQDRLLVQAETLRGDIRDALLTELKIGEKPWQQMNETEQERVIRRAENLATDIVNRAVVLVAHEGHPHLIGKVSKFTVKDGLKIEFGAAGLADNIVKLAQHSGHGAVLVLIEPAKYVGQRKPAETDVIGDLGIPRPDEEQIQKFLKGD